jgi:hypothetical protein
MSLKPLPVLPRLIAKAEDPDVNGCINWLGNKDTLGYGRISVDGKLQLVHRVSYMLYYGNYPKYNACHSCDNPSCINPFHLFDGTHQDNVNDKIKKGRSIPGNHVGEHNGRAKLTLELVRQIRLEKQLTKATNKTLSEKYNIGRSQMTRIINKVQWNDDYVDPEEAS